MGWPKRCQILEDGTDTYLIHVETGRRMKTSENKENEKAVDLKIIK